MSIRRNSINKVLYGVMRFKRVLALGLTMVGVALLVLACGPSAPVREGSAPASAGDRSPEAQGLIVEMEQMAAERSYDAVARVFVGTFSTISIPEDIDWSPYAPPEFDELRLHDVRLIETYDGSLPERFNVLTAGRWSPEQLDENQEYVLVLAKARVKREDPEDEFLRWYYNPAQLAAVGGESYEYIGLHAWVVEGEVARRLPKRCVTIGDNTTTQVEAARQGGIQLPVADLARAIEAGASRSLLSTPKPDLPVKPPIEFGTQHGPIVIYVGSTPTATPQYRTVQARTATPVPPLADQVRQFVIAGAFNAAARVRVLSSRLVATDVPALRGTELAVVSPLRRDKVDVIENYRGFYRRRST